MKIRRVRWLPEGRWFVLVGSSQAPRVCWRSLRWRFPLYRPDTLGRTATLRWPIRRPAPVPCPQRTAKLFGPTPTGISGTSSVRLRVQDTPLCRRTLPPPVTTPVTFPARPTRPAISRFAGPTTPQTWIPPCRYSSRMMMMTTTPRGAAPRKIRRPRRHRSP